MRTRSAVAFGLTAVVVALPRTPVASSADTGGSLGFGTTWTVDPADNALTEYAADASGAATPIASLSGLDTGLDAPTGVAISSTGQLFVTNAGNDSITEYAADAHDDTKPVATISGPHTGLDEPSSITMASGELWVTDPTANVVEAFTAGETGNVLPAESIAGPRTKLDDPVGIAVAGEDSVDGGGVTVINRSLTGAPSVEVFGGPESSTSDRGNVKPTERVTGLKHLSSPSAIMSVGEDGVWIADSASNSIGRYFVEPAFPGFPGGGIHREGVIRGAKTGIDAPNGLSQNALGQLLVSSGLDNSVRFFDGDRLGNVAPTRTITGIGNGAGTLAGAQVYGAAPSAPLNVRVKVHKTSAALSWQPPASDGGGVIGYQVLKFRFRPGEVGFFSFVTTGEFAISTTRTHFVEHHLKAGERYGFFVQAVNAFGTTGAKIVKGAYLTPPSAPRQLVASAAHRSIDLRWRPPRVDGGTSIRRYLVQWAAGCAPGSHGCTTRQLALKGFQSGVTIGSLKPHTKYEARVIAKNATTRGTPSAVVTATTT